MVAKSLCSLFTVDIGSLYRGSYMSAQVLLNLLNELRKRYKMRGLLNILFFFATSLINSIKQEHECRFYLSFDIKLILIS